MMSFAILESVTPTFQTPASNHRLPAYLFLGPEAWQRERCRKALMERARPPEDRENGFTRYDLDETDLTVVMDDARSFSLFATNRLIWVGSAEGALPRTRARAQPIPRTPTKAAAKGSAASSSVLSQESRPGHGSGLRMLPLRFRRRRQSQARSGFRSSILRFQRRSNFSVLRRSLAQDPGAWRRRRRPGLQIGECEIDLLIEILGSDASRIATEIEKLPLYAGTDAG